MDRTTTIRVVTWNVEGVGTGNRSNPDARAHLEGIAAAIARMDADIVCLQEIKADDVAAAGVVSELAQRTGLRARMAGDMPVISHGWRRLRTAILWSARVVPLAGTLRAYPDVPGLVRVDAELDGAVRLRLASYHARLGITARLHMAEQVTADLIDGPPAVVGMDRNAIGCGDPEPPRDLWYPRRVLSATRGRDGRANEDRATAYYFAAAELRDIGDLSPWTPTTGHAPHDEHARYGVKRRIDALYLSLVIAKARRSYYVEKGSPLADHCAVVADLDMAELVAATRPATAVRAGAR